MKLKTILHTTLCAAAVTTANAAIITGVTVDSFSSEVSFVDRLATNTIDGSGLTAGADAILGTADDLHGTGANDGWLTETVGNDLTRTITYNLGAVYDVGNLLVWNYNEAGFPGHGMQNVTIEAAGADGIFDISLGATFTAGTGTGDIASQNVALTGFNDVQFIRIDGDTNYGDNRFGLAEVRFESVAVPEPSSTALLGLGGLALILRRRK